VRVDDGRHFVLRWGPPQRWELGALCEPAIRNRKTRDAPGAPRYALKQRMEENPWSATVQESSVFMGIAVAPIVALIAGILIFFMPKLLNYIVALYLIIIGILGLIPGLMPGLTA